ncbi:hypothetical protein C4K25_0063 [Pseudomonas chlororaphis]|nr:hypothetical protein C4K25_0063 [Pseudomonas chlororaphis]
MNSLVRCQLISSCRSELARDSHEVAFHQPHRVIVGDFFASNRASTGCSYRGRAHG